MDEVYRGYRIATKQEGHWTARVTHVRGQYIPLKVEASIEEGEPKCLERARASVDRYLEFLGCT